MKISLFNLIFIFEFFFVCHSGQFVYGGIFDVSCMLSLDFGLLLSVPIQMMTGRTLM